MDYFSSQFSQGLTDEDLFFLKKVYGWVTKSMNSYSLKFSNFLDARQIKLCEDMFSFLGFKGFQFFGGFNDAERRILAVFSDYYTPLKEDFPVKALSFDYRRCDKLSHRDFLGCIMNLKIKREMLGDIIVDDGHATVFIMENMASLVSDSISKVGSVGVKITALDNLPSDIKSNTDFLVINGTVSSLRADCIISLITKLSREKVSNYIKSGNMTINYSQVFNISEILKPDDIISVKGYGKYIFSRETGMTKKGRINIEIKKYI